MAKRGNIFKCEVCGHVIQVHHEGVGTLVCCNQPMILLEEKAEDEGLEKHVPIIEHRDDTVMVSVGDVLHPMEDAHYIEFIELIVDDERYIQYLKPNQDPIVAFKLPSLEYQRIEARAYCNIHGLWKSE
ncbi:MAG: desulfoferrodoxin [Candidatus Dojkabacteria bacterium]|jgi:superoxide reductase|nr:desulfoferrodoxin [Candidatus Dojkabacteria bacterium]